MKEKLEKLEEIMKGFNQNAGIGVNPLSAKDQYFVLEIVLELLKKQSEVKTNAK